MKEGKILDISADEVLYHRSLEILEIPREFGESNKFRESER